MDAEHGPVAPLLVRWASPDAQHAVAAVLRDAGTDPAEVADLVRRRGVLVLSDLTLPPSAPLLATAAFRIDHPARFAQLIAIGVPEPRRRQGLAAGCSAGPCRCCGPKEWIGCRPGPTNERWRVTAGRCRIHGRQLHCPRGRSQPFVALALVS